MNKEKKEKSFIDETIDATEQVGRVVLKGGSIVLKTGAKAGGGLIKGVGKGINKFNQIRKDRKNDE